jgi:hypothetical protein
MNLKGRDDFSKQQCSKTLQVSSVQALSIKHFLTYLGSGMLLLHAKQQKKEDMVLIGRLRWKPNVSMCPKWDSKKGLAKPFFKEVSDLLLNC